MPVENSEPEHPLHADRRQFVRRVGLAVAGLGASGGMTATALVTGPSGSPQTASSAEPAASWLARIREQIPAATSGRYFQTAGIGPSPREVIGTLAERLEFQNENPVGPEISESMAAIEPRLRQHLGRSLGAAADEVALTHSTSEGINIVSWSIAWREGDEVIISNQEHPSNIIPWYNLRERFGIVLREIDMSAAAELHSQVQAALSERTRLVSLSHVSRNNGRLIPTDDSQALAEVLRARRVRYHLDGAQGPGCVPVDFRGLGCDYYSTCGHKWLLGPKGTGALLVRRAMLDQTLLSWTGAHSHATMDYTGGFTLKPDASRFEFGTRALATFAGFDAALDYWDRLGWERIFDRNRSLVDFAIERIDRSESLELSSPRAATERSAIVSIRTPEGVDTLAMYRRLREEEGVLASPVREPRDFRLALHCFNTEEDIEVALEAIERFIASA